MTGDACCRKPRSGGMGRIIRSGVIVLMATVAVLGRRGEVAAMARVASADCQMCTRERGTVRE
jgi:hypothetical protein